MGRAVQLHDHLGGLADEVGEVSVDRMLAQEAEAAEAAVADEGPEGLLGQGLASTKATGGGDPIHDRSLSRSKVALNERNLGFSVGR
jgi:hypothetical protein